MSGESSVLVKARPERLAYVDAAKAIGIVLVVVGHSPGLPWTAALLIYSFHMPLFFFISGFLQGPSHQRLSLMPTVQKSARSLLLPYVFFFGLSLLYWLATRSLGDRAAKFVHVGVGDALVGFFSGLSSDLFVNQALWFFPCLFACVLLFALFRRVMSPALVLALASVIALVMSFTMPWKSRLPLGLDIAWIALVFYALGACMRDVPPLPRALSPKVVLMLAPLAGGLWFWLAIHQPRVDFAYANFGHSLLYYVFTAICGIALVFLVAMIMPRWRFLNWLADNSLIIFPVHALLLNFASGLLKFINPPAWRAGPDADWALLMLVWVIAVSVPISWFLTRYCSALLGRAQPRIAVRS